MSTVEAVNVPTDVESLLWIGEMAVDPEIFPALTEGEWVGQSNEGHRQSAYDDFEDHAMVLFDSPSARLFAFNSTTTAALFSSLMLSRSPTRRAYSIPYPPSPLLPVAQPDVDRVLSLLHHLSYDKKIGELIESLNIPQMHKDVRYLTGEREDSKIESRHSFHPDARKAANWIREQIESTGASCELKTFLTGFTPNIIWRVNL